MSIVIYRCFTSRCVVCDSPACMGQLARACMGGGCPMLSRISHARGHLHIVCPIIVMGSGHNMDAPQVSRGCLNLSTTRAGRMPHPSWINLVVGRGTTHGIACAWRLPKPTMKGCAHGFARCGSLLEAIALAAWLLNNPEIQCESLQGAMHIAPTPPSRCKAGQCKRTV